MQFGGRDTYASSFDIVASLQERDRVTWSDNAVGLLGGAPRPWETTVSKTIVP